MTAAQRQRAALQAEIATLVAVGAREAEAERDPDEMSDEEFCVWCEKRNADARDDEFSARHYEREFDNR